MAVILAIVLLLLMTPIWVHFAMSASAAPGIQPGLTRLSDLTVNELLFGPGTFSPFSADEAAHLRDVRLVLYVFLALAIGSAGLLAWSSRRHSSDPRIWRSISRGGAALAVTLVALGAFAALAFGIAFELFHRILFPGGNWAFSEDSLLIRLYPYGFWQLSAAAFGVLGILVGLIAWFVARRRARALAAGASSSPGAT